MSGYRLLVIRKGCPFCMLALKAVQRINRYLPDSKKIEIIDNFQKEEFNFNAYPILDKLIDQETFDGYPYIFIDGIVIEPAPTENLLISISKVIEEDFVMQLNFGGKSFGP